MKKIIVNGIEREVEADPLSYEAILFLANKETRHVPTVTYSVKDARGTLDRGDLVPVVDGMIFNVTNTGGA
jgi:hypothetical protein